MTQTYRDKFVNTNAALPKTSSVHIEELMRFLFPAGLQHPLVAGRLVAFGMYGPLDPQGNLSSGEKGMHKVQSYELDAMCDQFEREDITQVYIDRNRPLATLSFSEKAEMMEGANRATKTTRGKLSAQMNNSQMPAFTQEQIVELFASLPRGEDGGVSFHLMQERIVQFRADRIRMLREMDIHGKVKDPPSWIMIETDPQLKAKNMRAKYAIEMDEGMKKTGRVAHRKLGGPGLGRSLVSNFVAPPTMFIKNEGFTPNEAASFTNKMLSSRVYKMSNIGPEMNNPGLVQNVYLQRQSAGPERRDVAPWTPVYK
jgi:hypothetical protein